MTTKIFTSHRHSIFFLLFDEVKMFVNSFDGYELINHEREGVHRKQFRKGILLKSINGISFFHTKKNVQTNLFELN